MALVTLLSNHIYFYYFNLVIESRSLISHKEKSRELLKVRNELLLLKSKLTGKGKAEVEQIIKSQQDSQKVINHNIIVIGLKCSDR